MTEYTYKIIIHSTGLYREIQLKNDFAENVKIGTTKNCKVRFDRADFFADFEIEISKDDNWNVSCYNSVYIDTNDMIKSHAMELYHGSEITFKYESSNSELFKMSFLIDFDDQVFDFNRVIDISQIPNFEIGAKEYNLIRIMDPMVGDDSVTITRQGNSLILNDNNTKYGVYINGRKAQMTDTIYPYDFFMLDGYYFYYKDNKLYTSAKENIISKLEEVILKESYSELKYPEFNRSVRMKIVIPDDKINILPPKELAEAPDANLAMTVIPSIISLVIMMMMRSMMGGNKMFLVYCGATMGMGIITSVITYFQQGKKYKKSVIDREKEYTEYVKKQEEEIKEKRCKERDLLCDKFIDIDSEKQIVREFSPSLFEKTKEDDDYLTVRFGTGDIDANCKIEIKEKEFKNLDDKIADYPELLRDTYSKIESGPVVLNLRECNGIGIVGSRNNLYELLKILTVDIATRHFYDDVKIYYIFKEEDLDKFMPFRWLKHVGSDDISIRNFMYNEQSKKIMLEFLYKELSRRDAMKDDDLKSETHHVIFVYDSKGFSNHPVSNYLEQSKRLGFTFIFLEEYQEFLPEKIDYVVYAKDYGKGILVNVADREDVQEFTYDGIETSEVETICMKLGCINVQGVSLENNLISNISLFKLLGIVSITDIDLDETWRKSIVYKTMAAPLGVNANNEIVYLDLNEKKHGPHGLVAGTTGSGKSEILQTYILSMALKYHPYEVGFVIIDFKGGGMVNQFANLPHLIGAITNIDGREIERSLLSIRAELKKRQAIFAEYKVNHIDSYIKLFKNGKAERPLPHLILIVDEFAELKNDQPEFMKELISAARIGRSLGVHLILATQKPSGVVDNQIWSNSKFKLCLKVQDKSDSNEVLKSPLAAEIKEPGRAYLQVGNNEIFELFQSAYSGADTDEQQAGLKREYEVAQLNLAGIKKIVFSQKNTKKGNTKNQLETTVEYINSFCQKNSIPKLQGICLPSLPETINYEYIAYNKQDSVGVMLGYYDDPDNQNQDVYNLNLTMNHLFILGSAQYGKTNMLQTIIKSLVSEYSPKQVNIYILDFASMILKNFYELKHVGGVITASEDEKIKNFFRMMHQEVAKRKNILADLGISSFSSYLDAGYSDLPQIVIAVDNFTALKELYFQREDLLLPICREGVSVGINVICTDTQSSGMGYRYLSNFAKKIALFTNNEGEYNNVFGYCRMRNRNVPGRAIVEIDKTLYEFQTFLAFEGEKEIERVAAMRGFVEDINSRYGEECARKIPEIPKILDKDYVISNYNEYYNLKDKIMLGLDYNSVDPIMVKEHEIGLIAISGKEKGGKGTFVRNLISFFDRKSDMDPYELYVIDDVMGKYSFLQNNQATQMYDINQDGVLEVIDKVDAKLTETYNGISTHAININNVPNRMIIIQNRDAIDVLSKSKAHMDKLKNMISKYKNLKASIVIANLENVPISFSSGDLLKIIKDRKNIVFLDNINAFKMFEIPPSVLKEFQKPIEMGDGYYITSAQWTKCKFIKAD